MKIHGDIKDSIIQLTPINGGKPIELQGVLQNLSVNGEILIDSNNSAGNGSPQKVMRGYKDKTVSITLRILPTAEKAVYMLLEELHQIFQNKEDNIPTVYKIVNTHINAREINEVLFTGLSSSEDNSTDTLNVSLNFEEFISTRYQ